MRRSQGRQLRRSASVWRSSNRFQKDILTSHIGQPRIKFDLAYGLVLVRNMSAALLLAAARPSRAGVPGVRGCRQGDP